MISGIHRPTKILVDLAAIKSNVENEIKNLKSGQKLWAVVKANGYGHGSVVISKTAIAAGAQGLCVAILDEAIELRKAGIKVPILVLGITLPKFASLAAENDISLTVGDLDWLKQTSTFLSGTKLKIHLAIDSGMGRIGFNEDDAFLKANDYLLSHPEYDVEGMFTHFSTADCHDLEYFDSQVKKFDHFKKMLRIKLKYIHCDNSAASIFNRQVDSDLVRYGIAMYGLNPSSAPHGIEIQPKFTLQPALCFVSELVFVKQIHANNAVGYGATFKADTDEWIGTVPVGYADGWQRSMQGFKVKVGDVYCPIVGRVCMDQFMVLLPEKMPVGTPVELISADAKAPNNIKAVADYANTIHYEIACLLSDRVPREYLNKF